LAADVGYVLHEDASFCIAKIRKCHVRLLPLTINDAVHPLGAAKLHGRHHQLCYTSFLHTHVRLSQQVAEAQLKGTPADEFLSMGPNAEARADATAQQVRVLEGSVVAVLCSFQRGYQFKAHQ